MVGKGEALKRRPPAKPASAATPKSIAGPSHLDAARPGAGKDHRPQRLQRDRSAKPHQPKQGAGPKTPLNRLVIACVGCATLASAVGTAWRERLGAGHAIGLSAHSLILGLEVDLAAGAAALAVALCLTARLQRRSDATLKAVAEALAALAADPDPRRLKPLEAEGDLAWLAEGYNAVLAGVVRRERQATFHTTAQVEKHRLAELAMLRQDMAAPLATAESWARSLAPEGAGPEVRRRDRRVAEALGRIGGSMLATLDDITRRTYGATNGLPVSAGWLDVCEVTEDVCTLLWTKAAAKGLDLAVYIDPKTPRLIQGDAVRLRQIIVGLVSSALAATPDGGVLIEVERDSAASIRISIHDTGPALTQAPGHPTSDAVPSGNDGFAAETRPGDPDGTLPARMAIYRQMLKAMGGGFAAPPRRDKGATFAFRIPAEMSDAPTPWASAAPAQPPKGETSDGGASEAGLKDTPALPPRVLLAVRGPCTRRALSRYLARAGLAVGVYDGAALPADARLLIGDAAGLSAAGPVDIPVARLVPPEDLPALDTLSGPASAAILSLPISQAELEALLRRVNSGRPLQPEERTWPRAVSPPASGGATGLSDDERTLIADLDRAAQREEFSLVYQPQVEREGERILGVEALLRWSHPTRGQVSPSIFIPLAEKAGRISDITAWVVDRMLAETQYLSGLQVSFNASALEFADKSFVDRLLAAVADTGYDPRRLEVEITETAILHHETPVLQSMERLHAAGIGVALDDFGAGYSSLSHLRRYPFDKLKIDREFITDCSRDMESATVVHAVVSIGRALGMKVIAEGVETETQRNFLRIAGVYAMQGYLFGKPMPIDGLAPLIGAARIQARG